jgi:hypothetical protein
MSGFERDGGDISQLRERLPERPEKPQHAASEEQAKDIGAELNRAEANDNKNTEKRTYGRTPDGTSMQIQLRKTFGGHSRAC